MPSNVFRKIKNKLLPKSRNKEILSEQPETTGLNKKDAGAADESLWKPGEPRTKSKSAGNSPANRQHSRQRSTRTDENRNRTPRAERAKQDGTKSGPNKQTTGHAAEKPAPESKSANTSGVKEHASGRQAGQAHSRGRSENRHERHAKVPASPEPVGVEPATAIPDEKPWQRADFNVQPRTGSLRFHDLDLPDPVMRAVSDLGFQYCTPIQAEILPHILKGKDASGRAQTGTGKTAAFLLCILNHFIKAPPKETRRTATPRALILAPTRELVLQIEKEADALAKYCNISVVSLIGGIDFKAQTNCLMKPVDIIVATPGRLLDFCRRRHIHLGEIEILVIDEADRMLDMGFIPDVRSIIRQTPPKANRQTLLFSATLTEEVTKLAGQWTSDPVTVAIKPEEVAVDSVKQMVYITTAKEKFALLYNLIKQSKEPVMVFGNRRDVTGGLMDRLKRCGINCALLSGAVTQSKRQSTLEDFKSGKIDVLVATDVAGRGIHVDNVGFVINYNLPEDPEDYVHRIGRTGRAGAAGTSISFACEEESFAIPHIEKYMGKPLSCVYPEEFLIIPPDEPSAPPQSKSSSTQGRSNNNRRGGRPSFRRGPPRDRRSGR